MTINWEVLANDLINRECELYGVHECIITLLHQGLTKEELESLSFDRADIDQAYISYMTEV
jgi:hypothetical protein